MKENDDNNDHYKEQFIKTNTNKDRINVVNNNIGQEKVQELEPIEEYEKRSCIGSCCFYMFCCCCCHSRIRTKDYFKKNWKNYLFKEGTDASDLPFNKLTNLFANGNDEAIEALGDFRLNPNLVSENKLRNDLEFYIPQLCTFLLFGDIKAIEEFFVFLCKVCNASFFFAHRVHWFLSAMINAAQEKKQDIINILKMVNTVFKSPSKKLKNKIEKFYIANSDDFIKYIKTNNLYFLYDSNLINDNNNIFDKINYSNLSGYQQELFCKYKKSRDIIIDYSNKEYEELKQTEEEKNKKIMRKSSKKETDLKPEDKKNITNNTNLDINTEINNVNHMNTSILPNTSEYKFKSNEFLIDLSYFKLMNEDLTYEEDEDFNFEEEEKKTEQKDVKPSDLYTDKLTDNFININKGSTDINFISYHSTINFIEHLCDISNELPNHPIEEQMLFLYQKIRDINKQLPCNVYLPFLKDLTRNYLICHIPLEGARIFRTKTRCPLMLTFEMVRIDEINEAIKEEQENGLSINIERTKSISSISNKKDRETFAGQTLLKDKIISEDLNESEKVVYTGADYDLSKPVILNVNKKVSSKKNDNDSKKKNYKLKDIKEHELDSNYEIKRQNSKYEDSIENLRIKNIIRKFKQINAIDNDRTLISKTIFEPKFKGNLANSMSIPISTSSKLLADIPEKEEDEISEEKKKMIDEDMKKEETIPKNTKINMEALINVFGETFNQKGKNIKSKSLFGKLNTHKIFRCIIKTHEDLRQEQFATQLINEFSQIYTLEHTGLWLNTYEIISTGNDSGLVEMVNDSLSLDALKQKIDHISLSDFYLNYFGNGNSNSHLYKTAMKNYIASLAGYSLVCYFLQIKDRHNGNILIDNKGHLIHIDFGFMLSNAPGKGLKFETAPFKLSRDMVDCLGGVKSKYFEEFKKLLRKGFTAINKHRDKIIILVEMMWCGHGKNLDCFEKGQEAINELKLRLNPKENMKKNDINRIVDDLINQSVDNWRTKWYDIFQYHSQGIFY